MMPFMNTLPQYFTNKETPSNESTPTPNVPPIISEKQILGILGYREQD